MSRPCLQSTSFSILVRLQVHIENIIYIVNITDQENVALAQAVFCQQLPHQQTPADDPE